MQGPSVMTCELFCAVLVRADKRLFPAATSTALLQALGVYGCAAFRWAGTGCCSGVTTETASAQTRSWCSPFRGIWRRAVLFLVLVLAASNQQSDRAAFSCPGKGACLCDRLASAAGSGLICCYKRDVHRASENGQGRSLDRRYSAIDAGLPTSLSALPSGPCPAAACTRCLAAGCGCCCESETGKAQRTLRHPHSPCQHHQTCAAAQGPAPCMPLQFEPALSSSPSK